MTSVGVACAIAALLGAAIGAAVLPLVRRYVDVVPRWLAVGCIVMGTVLFALATWLFGVTWQLPAYLYFAALSVLLAAIDVRTNRLPNQYTLSAVPIMIVLLLLAAWQMDAWTSLWRALAGGVMLFLLFLILHAVYPPGLGLGDVKLSPTLGLALGWLTWTAPLWGACLGFIIGALVSIVLLASRRITRKSALAFGPALVLGAWMVVVTSTN